MRDQATESLYAGAAKLSPPAGIVAASIAGMSLQDWVYALTAIYTLLMIAHHVITKWIIPWRNRRKE